MYINQVNIIVCVRIMPLKEFIFVIVFYDTSFDRIKHFF